MEEENRFTITYRFNEVHQVMGWIRAGQNGCLVGSYASGKSNFVHFLYEQALNAYAIGQSTKVPANLTWKMYIK